MRTLSSLLSSLLFCVSSLQAAEAIVSRDAQIDNVQLHYLTAGHGSATVILLHGFAETSRMWRPIIPLLAEKFTVIAPDLPGIRSEEHTLNSSHANISYAVFCLKKK